MARYSHFGADKSDVLNRLPGAVESDFGSATLLAALDDAEARVEAALPDRVRRLLVRVEGEVLAAGAVPPLASAALSLGAASALTLYDGVTGDYADRSPAQRLDPATYALDEDGRTVAFDPPLVPRGRLTADYAHTLADGLAVLADLVAELAAARLARYVLGHQPAWVEALAAEAQARLDALADARTGIPELDAVPLYDDWERAARGTRCGRLVRV